MSARSVLSLLALLVAASAHADTPARAAGFLAACGDADAAALTRFGEAAYAPSYIAERGKDGLIEIDRRLCSRAGGLEVTRVIVETRDSYFALARGRNDGTPFRISILTGSDGRIIRRSVAPAVPSPTAPLFVKGKLDAGAIDAYLDQLAAEEHFSGSVAIARGDKVVYRAARGFADAARKAKVTSDTQFDPASTGKMFTAVAIGQLVDAGKLRFDDRVIDVLPDFPNRAMAEEITIRELLSHTSGLPMFFDQLDVVTMYIEGQPLKNFLPLIAASTLEPAPRAMYSNAGFLLLGAIVEKVSGQQFAKYVHRRVFDVAGMRDTTVDLARPARRPAVTYTRLGGDPATRRIGCADRCGRLGGGAAGGGYTTSGDLVRFLRALQGGRLVKPATLAELTRPRVLSPWGTDYGYGLAIERIGDTTFIGHAGDYVGTNAEAVTTADGRYTVVVLSNFERPAATGVADVVKGLIAAAQHG